MDNPTLIENSQPFIRLGALLGDTSLVERYFGPTIRQQYQRNSWFTPLFCNKALNILSALLQEESLTAFVSAYDHSMLRWNQRCKVALVDNGTHPFSAFQDMLYILLSGNDVCCKLDPADTLLMPLLAQLLTEVAPEWKERISFCGRLSGYDAVIANCKPENAALFSSYFKGKPALIRLPQRTCAVLTGKESPAELTALAEDIYLFFGMAPCSVTKLYVPRDYDFVPLLQILNRESQAIADHHQFLNHLDYQKAVRLMCSKFYMDAGTFLFVEDNTADPTTAVVHYTYYDQVISSSDSKSEVLISAPFGQVCKPVLSDFSSNKDPMQFLGSL